MSMYKSPTGGEYPQFLESLTNIVAKHINPACAADEINRKFIQPIIKERDELKGRRGSDGIL